MKKNNEKEGKEENVLLLQLHHLQILLEKERSNKKVKNLQRLYKDLEKRSAINISTLVKDLNKIQEYYLELNKKYKTLESENESLNIEIEELKIMNEQIEKFSEEQSVEIERGINIINNYLERQ